MKSEKCSICGKKFRKDIGIGKYKCEGCGRNICWMCADKVRWGGKLFDYVISNCVICAKEGKVDKLFRFLKHGK